jgi:hypothetical protein
MNMFHQPLLAQWVTRDQRSPLRGPWRGALCQELPLLYYEFNGLDAASAKVAETLLKTDKTPQIEALRQEVLQLIFSLPPVPPDEEQLAPNFTRMVWEAQKSLQWAQRFQRSLYDLFAADQVDDKSAAYRRILAAYLQQPEALTPLALDVGGKLWSFAESKSFQQRHRKLNAQIWSSFWLQSAVFEMQLRDNTRRQKEALPGMIKFYHGYLKNPPEEWLHSPLTAQVAPLFKRRFPEAAHILDNLHMFHDNINDILARPDLFPTPADKRRRILDVLAIYLHRNQSRAGSPYAEYRLQGQGPNIDLGPQPPAADRVLGTSPTGMMKTGPHSREWRHDHFR